MKSRGIISFVFDDGYEAVWHHVVPLLDKYEVPGVFALPLNGEKIGQETGAQIRPWQEWQELNPRHEIAAHGINHRDLTTLTSTQLMEELQKPAETLHATTLIYPGGAHNQEVVAQARKIYTAARTVKRGLETIPPPDVLQLRTFNFSQRNFSILKANTLAFWAYLTNSWLIETYHIVDTQPHRDIHSLILNQFAKHLNYVARLPVKVKTIKEVTTSL